MRAAWESLTWANSTGQAMVVDAGLPWRLISWEKAQYLPCWEVQKGLWFFTEFLETAGTAALERGSHEPLSDKHNRYTHVSIIELGPARDRASLEVCTERFNRTGQHLSRQHLGGGDFTPSIPTDSQSGN